MPPLLPIPDPSPRRKALGRPFRRPALWVAALLAALSAQARAAPSDDGGADGEVVLHIVGPHPPDPAWQELVVQVRRRTSIPMAPQPRGVAGDDEAALWASPALIWPRDQPAPALGAATLARFLAAGGTLWLDGGDLHPGRPRAEEAVGPLGRVAPTHVLFKTFYLLDAGADPGTLRPKVAAGVGAIRDGRLTVWASDTPLCEAWVAPPLAAASPDGEGPLRMAVNWLMYALCLDYKDDQVHLPYILRRRH